jgi:hypothetical protein
MAANDHMTKPGRLCLNHLCLCGVATPSSVFKKPLGFGENSRDPKNQFGVVLNLYGVTVYTPYQLLPAHSVEPYLINRLSTLSCRFHNTSIHNHNARLSFHP